MLTSLASGVMASKRSHAARRRSQAKAPTAVSSRPVSSGRPRWQKFAWMGGGLAVLGTVLLLLLGAQPAAHSDFDADRSFRDLTRQVEFGPRVPNTQPHEQCANYIVETLRPLCASVEKQTFTQAVRNKMLRMTNIVARWNGTGAPGKGKGVLLCAHWDTRPQADQETTPARRARPIPGANDGASGVAVLL